MGNLSALLQIVLGIPAARAGGLTPVLLRDIKHLEFLQGSVQNEC